jgi:hypothetical protein
MVVERVVARSAGWRSWRRHTAASTMNQTSWLISVTESTRRSPSNPPRMQADISSENSSITARPSRSKSFSTESVRWFPSQLHVAFLCQVRFAKLAVIHFAPSAPKADGTPSHCSTARYQAMAPLILNYGDSQRSPHERSDMRGAVRLEVGPGYRFAHPGYACLLRVLVQSYRDPLQN